ncbi:MAG: glycosyltransferase family 39 protein, partial [Alphaproteobacteria bacterium]|nr:glycosyltransferase family 39 protein [Alphaproteobacteria bacterium]
MSHQTGVSSVFRHKNFVRGIAFISIFAITALPPRGDWLTWKPAVTQFAAALYITLIAALCLRLRPTRAVLAALGDLTRELGAVPRLPLLAGSFLLFVIFTNHLSAVLFAHLPHVADSHAQYAGAKILAAGQFYLGGLSAPRSFDAQWFINDGKFHTFYPPGHMLLLALGHLAGAPWLVNPLLGGCALLAIYFLAREIGGETSGRIALLLTFCSPFILFMSAEYMNHATALLMATLFALFYIRSAKYGRGEDGFLSGVAMGYLLMTRPQTAAAVGFPFFLHAVVTLRRHFKDVRKCYARFALGTAPLIAFFLYYNWQTTGDPLLSGYEKNFGHMLPGLDLDLWEHWRAWLPDYIRAARQAQALHVQLFQWPISSLLLIFILFFAGAQKPFCGLLAAGFFCAFIGLAFTRFGFVDLFGPRYFYEVSGGLIALNALALRRLPALCRYYLYVRTASNVWRGLLTMIFCGLTAAGFLTGTRELYYRYANNYWEGNAGFYHRILRSVSPPALVLVEDQQHFLYLTFTLPPNENEPVIFAHGCDLFKRDCTD